MRKFLISLIAIINIKFVYALKFDPPPQPCFPGPGGCPVHLTFFDKVFSSPFFQVIIVLTILFSIIFVVKKLIKAIKNKSE